MIYNTNPNAIQHANGLSEMYNVQAKAYQCDISNGKNVQSLLEQIVQDFGKLDVFIANAGMSISKPILEQTEEEFRKQMDVNVGGGLEVERERWGRIRRVPTVLHSNFRR